jgi:hypothetical protein
VSKDEVAEVVEEVVETVEETPKETPQPTWPDNWRENIAGDDEKSLKQLQRYGTPEDVWKKTISLQQKLSSGEYKMALSKDPTDEELQEFRQINGIPGKPEEYDLKFDNGLVIGDDDKPIIDDFLKSAHEVHMQTEQAKKAVEWYYKELDRQNQEQEEKDQKAVENAEDALRQEFGNNYRREMSLVNNFLASAPEGLRENLMTGRLADGTPLGSSKEFILWMNHLARLNNPMGTLTGVEGSDPAKGIEERIKEIRDIMRKDKPRYKRDGMDKELMDLTEKLKVFQARG